MFFPNPNYGHFIIRQENNEIIQSIRVLNLRGEVVYKQNKAPSGVLVNLGSIPKGMYILQVKTGNEIFTDKMIVE